MQLGQRLLKTASWQNLAIRWALISIATMPCFGIFLSMACAQSLSPYAVFQNMSETELKTLQVKLSYVGIQNAGIQSLVFTEFSNTVTISLFKPFERPEIGYANDTAPPETFKASTAELKAVIDNVATLPNVTAGGVSDPPFLSFAMHNTTSGGVAFEAILSPSDTIDLFNKIRLALVSNKEGIIKLNYMGCAVGASESGQASDVTATVTTSLSGLRLKRDTNVFVGTLTVVNKSGQAISGPISAVFNLETTNSLNTRDGFTCKFPPAGRKFVNLTLTGNTLPAGQSAQATVEITNPDLELPSPTIQVLAGLGSR